MTTIGRWSPNKVRNKIIDAQWVSESRYAFELVKPSSVAVTGGSASATVSALGSVEFTSCETLSLNGVFSSGYDNYMIAMRHISTASTASIDAQLVVGGTPATGSNYTYQLLSAGSTSVTGLRATTTFFPIGATSNNLRSGDICLMYGPALAQPTACRSVNVRGNNGAEIIDWASTHSLSTAYDGVKLSVGSGNFTGRVAVYGMRG